MVKGVSWTGILPAQTSNLVLLAVCDSQFNEAEFSYLRVALGTARSRNFLNSLSRVFNCRSINLSSA